jgi:hypothetical protein
MGPSPDEIVWAVGLKYTHGFSRLLPSVITIAAMVVSMALLSWAMKSLPVGTAYADPGHKAPVMGPSPDEIRSRVVPQGGWKRRDYKQLAKCDYHSRYGRQYGAVIVGDEITAGGYRLCGVDRDRRRDIATRQGFDVSKLIWVNQRY